PAVAVEEARDRLRRVVHLRGTAKHDERDDEHDDEADSGRAGPALPVHVGHGASLEVSRRDSLPAGGGGQPPAATASTSASESAACAAARRASGTRKG